MLTQIYSWPTSLKRHLDAPLFQERNNFLAMKHEKGMQCAYLKQWAVYLLHFVTDFQMCDGSTTRISLDLILEKAEAWSFPKPGDYHKRTSSKSWIAKEYYIIRAIDFLDYIGLLDVRYYDKTVNYLVESKRAKANLITAPFYNERMEYIESCRQKGFIKETLQKHAQYQLHLIKFLDLNEFRIVTYDEILNAAVQFFNFSDHSRNKKSGTKGNDKYFIGLAIKWLSSIGMYKISKPTFQGNVYIEQYLDVLRYKGNSVATIDSASRSLHKFYNLIDKQDLEEVITITDVDKYIELFTSKYKNRRTIECAFSRIRPYLRYAADQGWCIKDLDKALIMPRIYEGELLPSFMPWETVQNVLNRVRQSEGRSALRNYAIVLLLATYGLRSGEVANLKISDIDWRKEHIHIRRSKSGKKQTLPLLHSVGEAIIAYLREVRPKDSNCEALFVSAYAPIRPITNETIYGVVSRVIKDEEVKIKHKGPHSLRHSHATYLINNGQTMKEIGDLLGHRSQESTRIYAKVDFKSLREVSDIDFDDIL